MATKWSELSGLGQASIISGIGSTLQGIVGSYYAASTEKYKTKLLALNLQHKKDMTLFNKRMKESQAQHINRVFNKRYQIMTLKQGAEKSRGVVSIASRGGVRGVGSNLNAMVSSEILAEIDKMTMNSNKVRARENKRLEAVGVGIQANQYGVSASNMFATASQISPWMNMTSSLLTGGSSFISSLPPGMLRKS